MLFQGQSEARTQKRATIAQLYETHYERVARYIAVRIGNVSEAEDLASEVFVKALRKVDSFKEKGIPMEVWIFRIAHNLVVDHLRKRGRQPTIEQIDEGISLPDKGNPGDRLEKSEELRELRKAMEKLTELQRRVLALRFGAELRSDQAAEVLGKAPGAIRETQSSAIKKLRTILAKHQ